MKYRIVTDLYLSEAKVDLKAPGEFDSKEYGELTPEMLERLVGNGAIEAVPPEKAVEKKPKEPAA